MLQIFNTINQSTKQDQCQVMPWFMHHQLVLHDFVQFGPVLLRGRSPLPSGIPLPVFKQLYLNDFYIQETHSRYTPKLQDLHHKILIKN